MAGRGVGRGPSDLHVALYGTGREREAGVGPGSTAINAVVLDYAEISVDELFPSIIGNYQTIRVDTL